MERLRALVAEVGEFRIRDRRMADEQKKMTEISAAREPAPEEVERYLRAIEHAFRGFESEARGRLGDLDKRIAQVNQVQFNLQAERGVALRRIERTQGVLSRVAELGGR